jgi:hypothetical protein
MRSTPAQVGDLPHVAAMHRRGWPGHRPDRQLRAGRRPHAARRLRRQGARSPLRILPDGACRPDSARGTSGPSLTTSVPEPPERGQAQTSNVERSPSVVPSFARTCLRLTSVRIGTRADPHQRASATGQYDQQRLTGTWNGGTTREPRASAHPTVLARHSAFRTMGWRTPPGTVCAAEPLGERISWTPVRAGKHLGNR